MSTRSVYDFLGYRLHEFPEYVYLDFDTALEAMPHWYAVCSGDGNDGVSHHFPDYYVRTCEPYRLAELAMITAFQPRSRKWAKDEVKVDGEAEFGISATVFDPPDSPNWSEHNGAWRIIEVEQVEESDVNEDRPVYLSLADCFGDDVSLVTPD